jgi:hypothetical protein
MNVVSSGARVGLLPGHPRGQCNADAMCALRFQRLPAIQHTDGDLDAASDGVRDPPGNSRNRRRSLRRDARAKRRTPSPEQVRRLGRAWGHAVDPRPAAAATAMQVPAATPAAATGVGAAEEIEESSLNATAFSRENGCGGPQPSGFNDSRVVHIRVSAPSMVDPLSDS